MVIIDGDIFPPASVDCLTIRRSRPTWQHSSRQGCWGSNTPPFLSRWSTSLSGRIPEFQPAPLISPYPVCWISPTPSPRSVVRWLRETCHKTMPHSDRSSTEMKNIQSKQNCEVLWNWVCRREVGWRTPFLSFFLSHSLSLTRSQFPGSNHLSSAPISLCRCQMLNKSQEKIGLIGLQFWSWLRYVCTQCTVDECTNAPIKLCGLG